MGLTALVMAGGRGTRVRGFGEKPLLQVSGKSLIGRVIEVLEAAEKVSEVVIAVSKYTPQTKERLKRFHVKTVDTSGDDYVSDMRDAIKRAGARGPVLVVAADLPLLTEDIVNEVVDEYHRCGKPALMVAIPVEILRKLGLKPSMTFRVRGCLLAPAGINIVDANRLGEGRLAEHVLVSSKPELAFNINSVEDVKLAESFLAKLNR